MASTIEGFGVLYNETAHLFPDGREIFASTGNYLLAVIITNTQLANANASVYVKPGGTSTQSEWALIVYKLTIPGNNSYETFRFGVNAGDLVYVSGTMGLSYYLDGIEQVVL
jgi:hypothetical protein